MSKTKNLLKGAAAAIMAVAMALVLLPASAFAATQRTITIEEPSGQVNTHTYEAFQIFKGDLSNGKLSNVQWGEGVESDALLTALKADNTIGNKFTNVTTAPEAAEVMATITDNPAEAEALAKVVGANISSEKYTSANGKIIVPTDGYYFIKDVSQNLTSDTYSKYVLKVAGDVTVTAKDTTTTSAKYVKDTNTTTGATTDWQKVADYDMGAKVPFKLEGTVASDYASYSTYYFQFVDTYDKEQFGTPQSIVVKIDGATVTNTDTTKYYTVSTSDNGFTITFDNLKQTNATAGSKVTVEYTAELLSTASVGATGNQNKSHIVFSNNPNQDGVHGQTPDDNVIVFTYKVVVNKTDGTNPLAGASFKLQKKVNNTWTDVKTIDAGTTTRFEFVGLDDGTYKLVEAVTPAGYNSISDIEFTVTSVKDNDGKTLTSINGITGTGEIELAGSQKANVDKTAGSITTTVVNRSGSVLPSTGGAGTTMLYVGGAALAAAAAFGIYQLRKKDNEA